MSQGTPILKFLQDFIVPAIHPDRWFEYQGPVQPNVLLKSGTVVGRVTSANTYDVQTLTFSATPASGSFGLQVVYPNAVVQSSVLAAWNATGATALANVQAMVDSLFGSGNATVTGSYAAGFAITFNNYGPQPVVTVISNTLATGVPAAVTITVTHTTTGVKTGVLAAYASGNTDGTQVAVGVLSAGVLTGPDGSITYGQSYGNTQPGKGFASRYVISGYVATEKLTGLDSGAITTLGRLITGTSGGPGILALY